jgi:hypothetical protein
VSTLFFGGSATLVVVGARSMGGILTAGTRAEVGIGQEVRHGKFVFVVTDVSTSANLYSPQEPPGGWVIATLTVRNVDGNSHSFAANCQKLIDSTGRVYDAAAIATTPVNSGATITAEVSSTSRRARGVALFEAHHPATAGVTFPRRTTRGDC